jgi:hypothetical protein
MHFKPDLALLLLFLLLEQNKIKVLHLCPKKQDVFQASIYADGGLPMGWAVRRLNPGGGKIFCALQASTKAHPTSCSRALGLTQG